MGKRSGVIENTADYLREPLEDLDAEIRRCTGILSRGTIAANRKSLQARLRQLEKVRAVHPKNTG